MKKLIIGLVAVIVLVIGAVLVIPFVVPVETVKSQLLAQVKEATGREARIDGDFKIAILPRVEFVAGKVSFANAKGSKTKNMVSVDRLNVQVALFPLLGGKVEIDAFVLEKPVISLEIDKNGKPNWEFGSGKKPATKASAVKSEKKSGGSGGTGLSGLKLGDVRLVDGQVSYSDARTGKTERLEAINLKIALPSLDSPMKADGSLIWNKEKIDLSFGLSNPNGFLNGKKTDVETRIATAPVTLSFKGSAATGGKLKAGGALDLYVPSIRKLTAWVGAPLTAPGSGYGPLKITGQVDVDGAKYAFRKAKLSVDKISGSGEVAFDGGRPKPLVTAILSLGMLDLNPYLPPEAKAGDKGAAKPASGAGGAKPAVAAGWSDDPIDLSGLKAVDATLDLSVAGILIRKIKIGQSNLGVTLKNGVLVTNLKKMALYKGTGRAKLTANGAGRIPRIAVDFDLANFQANPFLTDAADFKRLEGAANADLKVTTQGRSQRELVGALNGAGKVTFLNGAIRGINIAAMLRNVASAFMDSSAKKAQKTDFAELGGTYVIKRGILTNSDLSLKSPLLRLSGKGTVDLPKQTVNYRLEPKIVASTKGQGGSGSASGISVPVIVSGPWANLSYKPDLAGALGGLAKSPGKALDALKGMIPGKSGSGGGALDALKGMIPGASGSGAAAPTAPTKTEPSLPIPDVGKTLKGLFGR
jgi:AsmA protein